MKQLAKITLCIPVYNAEKTIVSTLESLINQDYPIHKIKIFENDSTDGSRDICEEFSKRYPFIELYFNETNIGAEANFTKCIMGAEEDYCAIVHSDDIYESNFISKSVEVLEGSIDCVATFCGASEIDSSGNMTGKRFLPNELEENEVTFLNREDLIRLVFKYANFITCPSVLVRSNAYKRKIRNWNGEKYKTSADLDVWLRLSELGKIACINSPLMKYRVADASYSYRIAKKRITRHDLFLVLDEYKSKDNIEDYNFLALKDQSIRSLNIIRNNKREECFPCEDKFNLLLMIKKMCHSKWHLKMGMAIIAIKVTVRAWKLIGWNRGCRR